MTCWTCQHPLMPHDIGKAKLALVKTRNKITLSNVQCIHSELLSVPYSEATCRDKEFWSMPVDISIANIIPNFPIAPFNFGLHNAFCLDLGPPSHVISPPPSPNHLIREFLPFNFHTFLVTIGSSFQVCNNFVFEWVFSPSIFLP